jgi:hypothetical protein
VVSNDPGLHAPPHPLQGWQQTTLPAHGISDRKYAL